MGQSVSLLQITKRPAARNAIACRQRRIQLNRVFNNQRDACLVSITLIYLDSLVSTQTKDNPTWTTQRLSQLRSNCGRRAGCLRSLRGATQDSIGPGHSHGRLRSRDDALCPRGPGPSLYLHHRISDRELLPVFHDVAVERHDGHRLVGVPRSSAGPLWRKAEPPG